MAPFELEAASARALETDMETSAGSIRAVTVMEAHGPALLTNCLDHHMVGGALVGRRGRLQAQRGNLRLEQLGKLGIPHHCPRNYTGKHALTELAAGPINSPPRRPRR